jgi:NADH-quinone oxidoreductase subunit C
MVSAPPIESILDALREVVRTYAGPGESHALPVRRALIDEVWVTLPTSCFRPAVQVLVEELNVWHLSTITGQDNGSGIEVFYHFWPGRGLTLRCKLPYQDSGGKSPHLSSVSDLIPGAAFYEREVSEMLGITFDGHPDPGLLLLPDDWEGGAPLRRDYKPGTRDE